MRKPRVWAGMLAIVSSMLACKGEDKSLERSTPPACTDKDPVAICEARCRDGSGYSCYTLWERLIEGTAGNSEQIARAVDLLASHCNAGQVNRCSAAARLSVERMYGPSPDETQRRALELLEHGCDLGSVSSCETLAAWYSSGLHGVGKDFEKNFEPRIRFLRRACELEPLAIDPSESEPSDRFFIHELVAHGSACTQIEVIEGLRR